MANSTSTIIGIWYPALTFKNGQTEAEGLKSL